MLKNFRNQCFVTLVGFAAFSAQRALAVDERGNGGHVVVCRNGDASIRTIELLDMYEAREQLGFTPDLGATNLASTERALYALSRLNKFDSGKVKELGERVKGFLSDKNTAIVEKLLPYVPDTGVTGIPAGCSLEQLAIRSEPQVGRDRLFTISAPLWNALSTDSQAALMLHEALYEMAIKAGHTTSRRSRDFNAHLISNQVPGASVDDYNAWLSEHGFEQASRYIGNVKLIEASTRSLDGGSIGAKLFMGQVFNFAHKMQVSAVAEANIIFDNAGRVIKIESESQLSYNENMCKTVFQPVMDSAGRRFYSFYASGELLQAMNNEVCLPVDKDLVKVTNFTAPYSETERFRSLMFYPTGVLMRAYASEGVALPVAALAEGDKKYALVVFARKTYFEMHSSGFVKSGTVSAAVLLKAVDGTTRNVTAGTRVQFSDDGLLL